MLLQHLSFPRDMISEHNYSLPAFLQLEETIMSDISSASLHSIKLFQENKERKSSLQRFRINALTMLTISLDRLPWMLDGFISTSRSWQLLVISNGMGSGFQRGWNRGDYPRILCRWKHPIDPFQNWQEYWYWTNDIRTWAAIDCEAVKNRGETLLAVFFGWIVGPGPGNGVYSSQLTKRQVFKNLSR